LKERWKGSEDEEEDISRVGSKHVGAPGTLIIFELTKTYISYRFSNTERADEIFKGACPNCGNFWEKFFCVWKPEFTSTIFPAIPVTP
jgi:hypothetical protein